MREANVIPIDLGDFQQRSHRIAKARHEAAKEAEELRIEEAEAEHQYRKVRSVRLAKHRSDGEAVGEAVIHAEGDAADYKLKRDTAHALRLSAEERIAQMDRNAAMLNTEAKMSREAT